MLSTNQKPAIWPYGPTLLLMPSPRMPKDEEQVLAVEALIESWKNPFVGNQDLNSISTAKDALVDMSYDLLHACGI